MVRTEPFKCPDCGAVYQVVKVEAGPETVELPRLRRAARPAAMAISSSSISSCGTRASCAGRDGVIGPSPTGAIILCSSVRRGDRARLGELGAHVAV